MELFRLIGRVAVEGTDEAESDIRNVTEEAEGSSNKIVSAFKKIGAAVATYFAIDKIIDFGKAAVSAAAEVAAEEAAFSQIMGEYSDEAAKKVEKIADTTGMVASRLTPYMTSMSAKFKGLGYDVEDATDFASRGLNLAADAAAFWDKSLDESMSHLNSFINGSYEGGEAIGLFANDTQMAAYAVEKGIVSETKAWSSLDEATKQATRLEYAENMFAMSGATGQAAKESKEYANVQGNLTEKWRQFQATIGEPILQNFVLPVMTKLTNDVLPILQAKVISLIDLLKQAYGWYKENDAVINAVAIAVGVFVVALGTMSILKTVKTWIMGAKTAMLALNAAMKANIIGIIISAIVALVAAFIYLWNNCEGFREFWINLWEDIKSAFAAFVEWLKTAFSAVKDFFVELWANIVEGFDSFKQSVVDVFTAIKDFFVELWGDIVNVFTTVWETIKNVVTVAIMFIVELIKAAFDLITLPFRFIWENCKEYIIAAWEAIKSTVTNALNAVKEAITTVFNAVKDFITTVWNAIVDFLTPIFNKIKETATTVFTAIKDTIVTVFTVVKNKVTEIWNAISEFLTSIFNKIKDAVTKAFNAVKDTITKVFNSVKDFITSVWTSIKDFISNTITAIKTTVTNIFNAIKTAIEKPINAAKTTITNVFNDIKNAITKPIDEAKNLVKKGLDAIKGFFDKLKLKFPDIKLPHFSIKGKFSLDPPSVPKLAIDWYAKGGILTQPTAFGINPNGRLQVGGEAGDEAVAPISLLLDYIRTAVGEQNAALAETIEKLISMLADYLPEIITGMNRNVVLDSGVLVGKLAPAMDVRLGDINRLRGRGK